MNVEVGVMAAEQATGCRGAGSYLSFAHDRDYKHVEVLNWSSSAGDWTFLISKDGKEWRILQQVNNYPRGPGFSHYIDMDETFHGCVNNVVQQVIDKYY